MLTGNKGEWSEIYVLFKLLSEKKLFTGDSKLNIIKDLFYPVIKIIRSESVRDYEYEPDGDIVIISGGIEQLRIPVNKFTTHASKLLDKIKEEDGSFGVREIEAFMRSINCETLKAKSTSKTDIRIVIHDTKINQNVELGFSIKSHLGSDPTLLNAGKTTNFIYEIKDFFPSKNEINAINSIATKSKIKDRISAIVRLGGIFEFHNLEQNIFKNNLVLIDSLLPNILSYTILTFYSTNVSSIFDLTEKINNLNPLKFDKQFTHKFYEYKIKKFLTDIALGMTPSKIWNGVYDATGGYLIVKKTGDILCYHIYNRNQFEDYLFANTKLETASSTRHKFGQIYEENGKYYFRLNLQIRFK